jgi:uncharacterized membrane protein
MMTPHTKTEVNVGDTERAFSLVSAGVAFYLALTRPTAAKLPLAAGGSYLLYRGLAGKDPVYELLNIQRSPLNMDHLIVRRAVTINRPRADVYAFWRNFENLPRFMQHLQAVQVSDNGAGRHSHWVTAAPLGQTVEWDAEIVEEHANELIAWRSLPGSAIENSGRVTFRDAQGFGGTEVDVVLQYRPPLGSASIALARLFGEQPWQQVRDDLRRFKQVMETGEIPTIFAQSSGRIDEVQAQRAQLLGG